MERDERRGTIPQSASRQLPLHKGAAEKQNRCLLCGRDAGEYHICDRCYERRRMGRRFKIVCIGVVIIAAIMLLCGFLKNKATVEPCKMPDIEMGATGYVLKVGDSLWSLYEEYGEGISWERWQSEMYRRNDEIGSFMREGEKITIVYAKK